MRTIVAGAALVAAALWAHGASFAHAADVNVDVEDFFFEDPDGDTTTTIAVGDTVIWTWTGAQPHTVRSDTNVFDSGVLGNGGTFSYTFDTSGTFGYHCALHGFPSSEMFGTIVVQAPEPTATTTPTPPTPTASQRSATTPRRVTLTAVPIATPVTPVATPTTALATPIVVPINATQPAGRAGAGVTAPRTGDGAGAMTRGQWDALTIVLGASGLALIAGATVLRGRKP